MQGAIFKNSEALEQALDELVQFQRETISEKKIVEHCIPLLEGLQEHFDANPGSFTESHRQRLSEAQDNLEELENFMLVQEDMQSLNDLDEYAEIMDTLNQMAVKFANHAVSKRIAKEIRELRDMRHGLSETARSRIVAKLERTSSNCRYGHAMTLRKTDDWFWGCTHFPKCQETRELSEKEEEMLAGF